MSRREHGYALLRYADGATISFAASERERLETALRDGTRWFEGSDEYGGHVLCNMDGARAVFHFPPSAIAASRDEEKLDAITGES